MVDTLALGASGGNPVEVQVLSSAPIETIVILTKVPLNRAVSLCKLI